MAELFTTEPLTAHIFAPLEFYCCVVVMLPCTQINSEQQFGEKKNHLKKCKPKLEKYYLHCLKVTLEAVVTGYIQRETHY